MYLSCFMETETIPYNIIRATQSRKNTEKRICYTYFANELNIFIQFFDMQFMF